MKIFLVYSGLNSHAPSDFNQAFSTVDLAKKFIEDNDNDDKGNSYVVEYVLDSAL